MQKDYDCTKQLVLRQVWLNAKHNRPLNKEHNLSEITPAEIVESVSIVDGSLKYQPRHLIWKEGESYLSSWKGENNCTGMYQNCKERILQIIVNEL